MRQRKLALCATLYPAALLNLARLINAADVTGLARETDVNTARVLSQENEKLIKLNLELKNALAEARGEKAKQLELQIAELEQQLAARNKELFGDSSERRPSGTVEAHGARPSPASVAGGRSRARVGCRRPHVSVLRR